MTIKITTDASLDYKIGAIGIACHVNSPHLDYPLNTGLAIHKKEIHKPHVAEIMAMVYGLDFAVRMKAVEILDEVTIYTDCIAAVNRVSSWIHRNFTEGRTEDDSYVQSCHDMFRDLTSLMELDLKVKHVRGHQHPGRGRKYSANVQVDGQAKALMRELRAKIMQGEQVC